MLAEQCTLRFAVTALIGLLLPTNWSSGHLAYRTGTNRQAAIGTGNGGKAEGQAVEIVSRIDSRRTLLFNRAQQLAHSAVESVWKPLTAQ